MPKTDAFISLDNLRQAQLDSFAIRKTMAASREKVSSLPEIRGENSIESRQQLIDCMQRDRRCSIYNLCYERITGAARHCAADVP
jgi:hypothetical protein